MARTWRTAAAALIASVTGVGLAVVGNISPAAAAPTDLFFSEYIEGSSNNKALEIYNGTGAPVNLATAGYSIQMCFNGATSCSLTIDLTGTVVAGDVYVVAQASANAADSGYSTVTLASAWVIGRPVRGSIVCEYRVEPCVQ